MALAKKKRIRNLVISSVFTNFQITELRREEPNLSLNMVRRDTDTFFMGLPRGSYLGNKIESRKFWEKTPAR
jgi:hypothetical protein